LTDDIRYQARRWAWLPWTLIYVCCALLSFQRASHCQRRPSLCMDVYWVEAWLVDSSHGLHARGLLGVVTHLLAKNGPDVVILNMLVIAVSIGITVTLVVGLYSRAMTLWARLTIAVLLASPLFALFYEELGDPLMIAFALFLIVAWCIRRTSRSVSILVSLVACLVVVAVHEAALFLLVPALALISLGSRRPGRGEIVRYAALALPLLAAIIITKAPNLPETAYRSYNSLSGEVIPRDTEPFPVYSQLLRDEAVNYFGSPVKILQFVLKFPRVWCITLVALVLVSGLLAGGRPYILWTHWLYLSFCSSPLYVIAHDWGRFSIITFWLAVITMWLRARDETPPGTRLSSVLRTVIPERLPPDAVLFGVGAALILGAGALYPDFGINGMPAASLPIVVPTLIAWASWRAWSNANAA